MSDVTTQNEIPLSLKSRFPKKTAQLGSLVVRYCKFEAKKETLSDERKFNYYSLILMGSSVENNYGPAEVAIDPIKLVALSGLAKSKAEAKRLLNKGRIKIGEPYGRMKTLSTKKIFIKDPYNTMITINRSLIDWVFVTFEP